MVSEAGWPPCSSLCPSYSHTRTAGARAPVLWLQSLCAGCVIFVKFLNLSEHISLIHFIEIVMSFV